MASERQPGSQNLAQLLRTPFQALVSDLHTQLAEHGYADIPATYTVVFAHVDAQGLRLGELARRAQLTKQMVNYLVTGVEQRGYVERVPDPTDRRATIVRLTERGQRVAQIGADIIAHIEHEWAAALTPDAMAQLRALLERLVAAIAAKRSGPA